MKNWTTISILFNYEMFKDYNDDYFVYYYEKFFILISQIIWFSFWITFNPYMSIGSGIIIFILTFYLSYYHHYIDNRKICKMFSFSTFLSGFILIASITVILLINYWNDIFFAGIFISNFVIIGIYYSHLYDLIIIDYKYLNIDLINYQISIINIIINICCIFIAIFIKVNWFIIIYILKIIAFVLFISIKYYINKKEDKERKNRIEEIKKQQKQLKERKTKWRKEIQKGKFKTIICKPSEEEFIFKNAKIIYKCPRKIFDDVWKLLVDINEDSLMKKIENNNHIFEPISENDYFIKQTNIGDCFLVSSIISLVNIPGILDYLFYFEDESKDNYTDKDKEISLFCYLRGIRYIVKINNSFPSFKNEKDAEIYKKLFELDSSLSLIPITTSKNGIFLAKY